MTTAVPSPSTTALPHPTGGHNTASTPGAAAPITFDQALLQATARAKAAYPAECCRIERGLQLCLADAVTLLPDGLALVQSQSQPDVTYRVNGACSCPDVAEALGGRCKHRWGKSLYRWTMAHATQPLEPSADVAPAAPALPLPEATASVNCHITLAGRQVQVTLRDTNEARLLERLETLLSRYPVEEPPQPDASRTPSEPESWCLLHRIEVTRQSNARGA